MFVAVKEYVRGWPSATVPTVGLSTVFASEMPVFCVMAPVAESVLYTTAPE